MQSPKVPRIGVTTNVIRDGGKTRLGRKGAYRRAIAAAGGTSVLLPPMADPKRLDAEWRRLDGLLLTGGGDVDPVRFGEARHPKTGSVDPARDAFEIELIGHARRELCPVFAICRGVQVFNVAFGGTLIQDIPSEPGRHHAHAQGEDRDVPTHRVTIPGRDTRLAAATRVRAFTTNSFHHQAIGKPGPGLRIVAKSDDGIIEAVEPLVDGWFVLGVQWHPEATAVNDPISRKLFRAFVTACRR